MKAKSQKKIPFTLYSFSASNPEDTLDWALSVLANHFSHPDPPTPAAYEVFERLVRIRTGTTLGERVQEDLENLEARIKHLETGTNTRFLGTQNAQRPHKSSTG